MLADEEYHTAKIYTSVCFMPMEHQIGVDWWKEKPMATEKTTADSILAQLSAIADARIKPMFGEYVVYLDEKVIGQINENRLFIKVTKFGEQFAPNLERASPYPGAKAAFVVPDEKLADVIWLKEFVLSTRSQLK